MHIDEGKLRAYLDQALSPEETTKIRKQLANSPDAQAVLNRLSQERHDIAPYLDVLAPLSEERPDAAHAWHRFQKANPGQSSLLKTVEAKERFRTMFNQPFIKRYQPAIISFAVVAIMAIPILLAHRLTADEKQHHAGEQHRHEDQLPQSDLLAQQPRPEEEDVEWRGALEEDGVGGRGELVGEHEENHGRGIGEGNQPRSTVPRPPGRRQEQQDGERGDTRSKARDLPTGERTRLDRSPPGGEQDGRCEDHRTVAARAWGCIGGHWSGIIPVTRSLMPASVGAGAIAGRDRDRRPVQRLRPADSCGEHTPLDGRIEPVTIHACATIPPMEVSSKRSSATSFPDGKFF